MHFFLQIAMDPRQLFCPAIGRACHNLRRPALQICTFDIVIISDMQPICQSQQCLYAAADACERSTHGIAVTIPDPRIQKLRCVRFPQRLDCDFEAVLVHGVDQVAEHLFRAASSQRLNEKKDLDHLFMFFRIFLKTFS